MRKAVGYINESAGNSEEQKRAIVEYCIGENLEVIKWIRDKAGKFSDVAYGNWMGHKKIDAVVAASNMDVTGNAFEFYAYRCKLRMRNSSLVVAEWKDYPGYGLHRKIFEEFTEVLIRNELEHEPVRQSTGRIRKVRNGGYVGGQAPMGYKVEGGKLVVNPEEVPVVEFIMEEKHRGGTKLGTVEKLNAKGYKTRKGGVFKISTVQGIWNNEELYKGYRKSGDEWVKGQHEAILKD